MPLLVAAIANEEKVEGVDQNLLKLEGMDTQLAAKLAEGGVTTRDELADLAVDELSEMTGVDAVNVPVVWIGSSGSKYHSLTPSAVPPNLPDLKYSDICAAGLKLVSGAVSAPTLNCMMRPSVAPGTVAPLG